MPCPTWGPHATSALDKNHANNVQIRKQSAIASRCAAPDAPNETYHACTLGRIHQRRHGTRTPSEMRGPLSRLRDPMHRSPALNQVCQLTPRAQTWLYQNKSRIHRLSSTIHVLLPLLPRLLPRLNLVFQDIWVRVLQAKYPRCWTFSTFLIWT